jgi:hypothetical protein
VDWIVKRAEEKGLVIAMLPCWARWVNNEPVINISNASAYGKLLGARYKDQKNIVWVLGGDRYPDQPEVRPVWRALAAGLKEGEKGGTQPHLMTFHAMGGVSSSKWFHSDAWLDFNMIQTFSTPQHIVRLVSDDTRLIPAKPTVLAEGAYEGGGYNFPGGITAYVARYQGYWSLFAGGMGYTYGTSQIWRMGDWKPQLSLTGGKTMEWMRALMDSRPLVTLVGDQGELLAPVNDGTRTTLALRCTAGKCAMVYITDGHEINVNCSKIGAVNLKAWWYNPRTGVPAEIGTIAGTGQKSFKPPTSGSDNDWILVLDNAAISFPPPGTPMTRPVVNSVSELHPRLSSVDTRKTVFLDRSHFSFRVTASGNALTDMRGRRVVSRAVPTRR